MCELCVPNRQQWTGDGSLLLPCGPQGSNSGVQAWGQAPLPPEPSSEVLSLNVQLTFALFFLVMLSHPSATALVLYCQTEAPSLLHISPCPQPLTTTTVCPLPIHILHIPFK